jgi:plasmid maintenance system antidote protein VapI
MSMETKKLSVSPGEVLQEKFLEAVGNQPSPAGQRH